MSSSRENRSNTTKWERFRAPLCLQLLQLATSRSEHQLQGKPEFVPFIVRLASVAENATFLGLDKRSHQGRCVQFSLRISRL